LICFAMGAGDKSPAIELHDAFPDSSSACIMHYAPPANGSRALKKIVSDWKQNQNQQPRVIGGHKAAISDNPWQVAILAAVVPKNNSAQFCGGSAISSRWVITAAHCVDDGTKPSDLSILEGTASLLDTTPRLAVDQVVVHCEWTAMNHDSDIALLHLSSDLKSTPIVSVGLDEAGLADGVMVRVSGWGLLSPDEDVRTDDLYAADVPYVLSQTCSQNKSYGPNKVTANMLCAGKEGQDTCTGDSGGPATISINGLRVLVGIASWGDGCGVVDKPGVYTRVSRFRPWVANVTNNEVRW